MMCELEHVFVCVTALMIEAGRTEDPTHPAPWRIAGLL
jgi:hypothetical protein